MKKENYYLAEDMYVVNCEEVHKTYIYISLISFLVGIAFTLLFSYFF